jgi:programmed cell death protein 5
VSRIALVKPDLARNVSDRIIALAQSGQIRSKVEEDQLIQWLEQIQGTQKQTVVKIQRKSYDDDDDDY